jgi:DNA-binding XRE family transcriptional regulator
MTAHKLKAAQLVAAGKLTQEQIAAEVGVCRRTLVDWKKDKEFQAAVKVARDSWRPKARTCGISDVDWTIRHLKDRHKRLTAVMLARAQDEELRLAPGGKTGTICVTYKMQSLGEGAGSSKVAEYAVDVAMLQEMREIEIQIQTHLGTWKAKVELSGEVDINVLMEKLNAGRTRAADEKAARDAALPSA